jgi:hypothetical protein
LGGIQRLHPQPVSSSACSHPLREDLRQSRRNGARHGSFLCRGTKP